MLTVLSCDSERTFNAELSDELQKLRDIDQTVAVGYVSRDTASELNDMSLARWTAYHDSILSAHQARVKEIFEEEGYPGYDLVGKQGESNFWVLVQHCDSDPTFQKRVLIKLKENVDRKNANGQNYGLLTDRVKINTGEKQIYGTQVTFNSMGQAYPKMLFDSVNVNRRRSEVGLEPLEEYLNMMTMMNFDMNKGFLKSKGITKPKLYETDGIVIKLER